MQKNDRLTNIVIFGNFQLTLNDFMKKIYTNSYIMSYIYLWHFLELTFRLFCVKRNATIKYWVAVYETIVQYSILNLLPSKTIWSIIFLNH